MEMKMSLHENTIERVEFIQKIMGDGNGAQSIAFAIKITETLIKSIISGKKVLLKSADGSIEELKIKGVNG